MRPVPLATEGEPLSRRRRIDLRRGLDLLILVSSLVIFVSGAFLLLSSRQGQSYLTAPHCAHSIDALRSKCSTEVVVQVDHVITQDPRYNYIPQAVITWEQATPSTFIDAVPEPTTAFYSLHPDTLVMLKVWNGIPTALYPTANSAVRLAGNPLSVDDLNVAAGLTLLAVGLIVLVVHPLFWLLPRRWRPRPNSPLWHWQHPSNDTGSPFATKPLRVALVGLIALNILDVSTSIFGGRVGLYESNPLAASMVQQWGPIGGFFTLKLPALIAIVLAMTKLPRRIATPLAIFGCLVMVVVVLNNAELASSVGG